MLKSISVFSLAILISSTSIIGALAADSAQSLLRLKNSTAPKTVAQVRAEKKKSDERKEMLGETIKKQEKSNSNTFELK